jgi:hypothetical protein
MKKNLLLTYCFLSLGCAMSVSIAQTQEKPVNVQHEKEVKEQLTIGGIYQHYSGKLYRVANVYRHSEDLTLYVAYEGLYEDTNLGTHWIRPLEMFLETVEIKGVMTPRFKKVSDK